jgi:uncharacterized repeat protein (TIGR01451 family)
MRSSSRRAALAFPVDAPPRTALPSLTSTALPSLASTSLRSLTSTALPSLTSTTLRSLASAARAALVVAGLLLAAAAGAAPAAAQPTLKASFAGFTDVNGNGVLDCGEPIELVAAFATRNSGTPALTGQLYVPNYPGSAGFAFVAGSVRVDPDLTTGCTGTVTAGNHPGDSDARIDFSCPADPIDNNSWTLVVRYQGRYDSTGPAAFTAAALANTSDGATYRDAVTVAAGSVCSGGGGGGGGAQIQVAKTAAGPATPGSLLVYTVTATDQSGLGAGGVQLVEAVPPHATFSAAGSSPDWVCTPGPATGSLCRDQVGNLDRNGALSRFFAVTLDPTFPAAPLTIPNTACARLGPTTVAGCASLDTPAAGTPVLHLAKSLAPGPPQAATPGATLTYALAAANTGNQDLADAVLKESVPAYTAFAAAGSSPGWSCVPGPGPGGACTLDLGPLQAGGAAASRTFAVVVANPLPPLPPGAAIANQACVHSPTAGAGPPGVPDACASLSIPLAGTPMQQVTKTLRSGTATPGATLVYDLADQNTGNQGVGPVSASETVPEHTTFAAAASSPGWTCVPAGGGAGALCSLPVGTLLAGTTVHALFAVVVDRPLAAGVAAIANTGCFDVALHEAAPREPAPHEVAHSGVAHSGAAHSGVAHHGAARYGTAPRGAAARTCDTVTTPALGHPLLTLDKTYGGGPAQAGVLLAFILTAANRGDQDAAAVTLTETVPAHTTFVPGASSPGWSCAPGPPPGAAGATCTLALGPLAAGGAAGTATFAVRADSPLPAEVKQIANTACAAAPGLAPSCGQVSTPPPPAVPALAAELRDTFAHDILGNGLAVAGDDLAYTLTVANPSLAAALDLVVATPLDPHLTLDVGSVTTTAGVVTAGNAPGDAIPTVHLQSLAPGDSFTIRFTAAVGALPSGLRLLSSQSTLAGGNLSPTVSDDPDTPEPLDPTTTPVGTPTTPPVQAVPTLGTWGLVALVGGLGALSLARLRLRRGGLSAKRTLLP